MNKEISNLASNLDEKHWSKEYLIFLKSNPTLALLLPTFLGGIW
jgi:hypothetical protein